MLGYRSYMNILSVRIDKEAREGAVFVGVPTMNFASVELYTHFISYIQVQDDTVRGVVIVLICVLGDGTGPDLDEDTKIPKTKLIISFLKIHVDERKDMH